MKSWPLTYTSTGGIALEALSTRDTGTAQSLKVQRETPAVTDSYQPRAQNMSTGDRGLGLERDITGTFERYPESSANLNITPPFRYHSGYRGDGRRKMDPKEQAEIHAKKRKEREKIASKGVPEVWAASPPRPELE